MSTTPSVDPTTEKLLRALDRLLTNDYTIRDKTLLEKLLTGLDESDNLLNAIPIETHGKWFASVLEIHQRRTPTSQKWSINLYSFAVKYLAILVKTENRFLTLIEARVIQPIITQLDTISSIWEHSVFNAYMSLLRTLITHRSGILFVLEKDLWMQIFCMIDRLIRPAKYIEIQSSNYIANLIYESFEYGIVHLCEPIFGKICSKLYSTEKLIHNKHVGEFFVYNVYVKTLILFLEKCIGSKYESDVCQLIIQHFSLSEVLVKIKPLLNIYPIFIKNYTTLHLLLDRFTFWHDSDMEFILKSILPYITMAKDIQSYKQINNIYLQAIRYATNIENAQLADNVKFEKELIIGQLIPLKKCAELLESPAYEKSQFDCCIFESNNILNNCIDYDSVINEVAISSILNILDVVPTLKQESLNYLVTFFSKVIDQLLCSDNWTEQYQGQVSNYYKFLEMLSHVFICWTKIIECKLFITNNTPHSLIVPLVHTHSQIFDKVFHTSKFLQNGMKLISTALNNRIYIHEQYADDLRAFDKLCTTLNDLLLDKRTEIRDSCFECISTIAIISTHSSGYLFTDLLLKKDIPLTVLNTFKYNNDSFVRAKALQCLEEMVPVLQIWETSLNKLDLISHCLSLMQCEPEGIVRRQIIKLITALIKTNELSDQIFNEICVVMVHVSVKDPLWEVKIFAYMFWDLVIQKCIKKLYKSDNVKSIEDILFRLSETGCLHVLYIALKEEHDLVVQKKAISLSKYLLDFKDSSSKMFDVDYKFKNELVNCCNKTDQDFENFTGPKLKKFKQTDSEEKVLNSITTTNDCELLLSLKCTNANNIYSHDICLHQKTYSYISVNDFLKFTETYDFKECFAKSEWVISTRSGLSSMLDDIIGQLQNCCVEGADLLDCH